MPSFRQVDVFSSEPLYGNPVAVVHDADALTEGEMAAFARWTNLSETTFLLQPTTPGADYRLRIFTPGRELPFAGHPTLGSAHAWLEAGGVPATADRLVQECGVGLVELRRTPRLAFAAPPLVRSGSVEESDLVAAARALRIERAEILDASWADNGPGWMALLLRDADAVLALEPDLAAFGDLRIGVVGEHPAGGDVAVEVRAFVPSMGIGEDPVTGSLNAAIGQWLAGRRLAASYVAAQGTRLGRRGRVHLAREPGGTVWVGGDTTTLIVGEVGLGAGSRPRQG